MGMGVSKTIMNSFEYFVKKLRKHLEIPLVKEFEHLFIITRIRKA